MLASYLPLVFLAVLAAAFVGLSLLMSHRLGPHRPGPVKAEPYESGIIPTPESDVGGSRFAVKFYLVAMLFIVFDVEAVFFYPWATVVRDLGWYGVIAMAVFAALLFESYYYVLRKGGLQWD